MNLIAGDVGGTNTRLLLAEYTGGLVNVLFEKDYSSLAYLDFYEILRKFLQESNCLHPIDAACFGVAGPVKDNEARVTNLPWEIKVKDLCELLGTSTVSLINDFVAVSHGISVLKDQDVINIQSGNQPAAVNSHPTSVIMGAGTGLGVACRTWVNDHYHIVSSETGHTDFAPATQLQTELLYWLQKTHAHVSLESLLSGRGFQTIYSFLRDVKNIPESLLIRESIIAGDPAKVITDTALLRDDELCIATVELFVQIYGSAAGNVALHYYPVDEVLIAGGIAPKIQALIHSPLFVGAFTQKGLMTSNLQKIAIKLITQDRLGLHGALFTLY